MTTPIVVVVLGLLALSFGASAVPLAHEHKGVQSQTEDGVTVLKEILEKLQSNEEAKSSETDEISEESNNEIVAEIAQQQSESQGQETRKEDKDSRRKVKMQHALKLGLMEMARSQNGHRASSMQTARKPQTNERAHLQRGRHSSRTKSVHKRATAQGAPLAAKEFINNKLMHKNTDTSLQLKKKNMNQMAKKQYYYNDYDTYYDYNSYYPPYDYNDYFDDLYNFTDYYLPDDYWYDWGYDPYNYYNPYDTYDYWSLCNYDDNTYWPDYYYDPYYYPDYYYDPYYYYYDPYYYPTYNDDCYYYGICGKGKATHKAKAAARGGGEKIRARAQRTRPNSVGQKFARVNQNNYQDNNFDDSYYWPTAYDACHTYGYCGEDNPTNKAKAGHPKAAARGAGDKMRARAQRTRPNSVGQKFARVNQNRHDSRMNLRARGQRG